MLISGKANRRAAKSEAAAARRTARHRRAADTARPATAWRWLARLRPSAIPMLWKMSLSIGVVITIGMSLLGALIIHNQIEVLNQQISSSGRTIIEQMAESAKEPILANDSLLLKVLTNNLANADNVVGTAIYSNERTVLSSAGRHPFQVNAPYEGRMRDFLDGSLRTLQWKQQLSNNKDIDALSFMSPVRFKDVIVGHVLISFNRQSLTQSITDAVRSIVLATAVLITVGMIMSYLLGRRLTRPIYNLMDASRAIGAGHYDYQFEERRNDEIGFLMDSFNAMAQGMLQKKQVEEAFSRYVSPTTAQEIMANLDEVKLGGKHVFASVMFVDIVGFTAKSETMSPEGVAQLLNQFYTYINGTVKLYKGTIDKYMGDCAMLLFGIPESDDDHIFHSIAFAVFFQRLMERINSRRIAQGIFPVHFRIGVNTGEMLAGNMGSDERVQYTVVGDTVNLASRLCSAASTDQIIITEETYNLSDVRHKIIASKYQSVHVRGKAKPVSTYLVHDVTEIYQMAMEQQIDRILTNHAWN